MEHMMEERNEAVARVNLFLADARRFPRDDSCLSFVADPGMVEPLDPIVMGRNV